MAIRWLRRTQVLAVCVAAAGCRAGPVAVDAPPRAAPAEVQLLLAGDQQLWIADVKAGTARRVRLSELSPGDPPTRIVRRGGAFVLWGSGTQLWEPSRETLSPLVRDSWFFLPSTADDRVWLAFLDLESPPTVRAIRAMREITVRGEVTVPDARPPGGRWPFRAVRAGLLMPTADDRGVDVWDPVTDRVLNTVRIPNLTNLGPTDGNRLVSCTGRCRRLQLIDVLSGRERRVAAPAGMVFMAAAAAFSPSGDRLAVPVRSPGLRDSARRLAIVDLRSRTTTVIAGSAVPPGYLFTAWSSSGRDAFLSGGAHARQRVITWYRLGAARARPVRGTFGAFFDMAAS